MTNATLLKLLGILSSALIGLMLQHNPNFQQGATLIYDPPAAIVSSTTIPLTLIDSVTGQPTSSTIVLALQTTSSGIQIGLVAANVQDQLFINKNGTVGMVFPNQSSTVGSVTGGVNWAQGTNFSLDSVITGPGSYPFTIYASFSLSPYDMWFASATGTILAQ